MGGIPKFRYKFAFDRFDTCKAILIGVLKNHDLTFVVNKSSQFCSSARLWYANHGSPTKVAMSE